MTNFTISTIKKYDFTRLLIKLAPLPTTLLCIMNATFEVPANSSNHGNPHLLCTPPQWHDYVIFYFTNYFAHAATVVSAPGQGFLETLVTVISALLLPTAGISQAMYGMYWHPITMKNKLQRAARARALHGS